MRTFTLLKCLVVILAFGCLSAEAQTYQLVWSDEFNTGIGPDWNFETGGGGWGNNEKEYYQAANASVSGGHLIIQARKQTVGSNPYTSTRMNTAGKRTFKYGKIEASIMAPKGQGLWPAFWMLGSNIGSIGWPKCGEIDIMEQVNTDNRNYGTIHWDNNGHVSYGGNVATSINTYHAYSVTWDASAITWFVDGAQYHQANILNSINSTEEFHNPFFIILNLAVAGDWPGQTVDESKLPANLYVDYVRVYQLSSTPTGCTGGYNAVPGTIQAESYCQMNGVQLENTSDAGGGQNVGWIDTNDWMAYRINVPSSGTYTVQYRVASANGGGSIRFEKLGGGQTFGTISVNSTGGWQNWTTISHTVQLTAGQQDVAITAAAGGFNLNWISISGGGNQGFSQTVQAENYNEMLGIQTENTSDTGGGLNVGWIDTNDWLKYNNINVPSTGAYKFEYRVASPNSTGVLSQDLNSGSIQLGTIAVPNTGGWQNWTTISRTVNLNAGTYNFGIFATAGGWNINWWRISSATGARIASSEEIESDDHDLAVFPNPSLGSVTIQVAKPSHINIMDTAGKSHFNAEVEKSITIDHLNSGLYIVRMKNKERTSVKKLLVK